MTKLCPKIGILIAFFCDLGLACGPVKNMGSVSYVVVAGGIKPAVSNIEVYNVKENTWAAGKKET